MMLPAFVLNVNVFKYIMVLYVPFYMEVNAGNRPRFFVFQMVQDQMSVKEIENENALLSHPEKDVSENVKVILFRSEIAETGKKVENIVKIVRTEGMTHIMGEKREVLFFKRLGKGDILLGEV